MAPMEKNKAEASFAAVNPVIPKIKTIMPAVTGNSGGIRGWKANFHCPTAKASAIGAYREAQSSCGITFSVTRGTHIRKAIHANMTEAGTFLVK